MSEIAAREFARRRHGVVIGDEVVAAPTDERIAVENPATEEGLADGLTPVAGSA